MDFTKKPIIYFTTASITLLVAYAYIFINKTNIFPASEIFCWISSTIIALIIISTLYESQRISGNENITISIIIYLLFLACILCSLGLVWNASNVPEIKLRILN
jgi:hypothetical protein